MRRKDIVLLITALAAASSTLVMLQASTKKADSPGTVRIGATTVTGGLIYIAEEKGYFKQHGVDIAIKTYEAGALAFNGLLADAVDVAAASEFVLVRKGFDDHNLRAFAQIANTNLIDLVVRKDRIENLSDLKGKKIGLLHGSISEFFLGSFLKHYDIPLSSVEVVDLTPLAAEEAMYNGSVDAVVVWEPNTTRIKERLGKNAMSWPVQGRDDFYLLLVAREGFLRRSPATQEKMLRALIDAEAFADKHPEEAQRIIDVRLKLLRPGDVQLALARCALKVRLDQGLLTLMEAEANWMIRNNLTQKKEMPNYLDMIDLKPLEAVKPEAVGIIH